jgi:hypothetical protein
VNGFGGQGGSGDAFTKFWSDVAAKMMNGMNPFQQQAQPTQEAMARAMRQAFLDAWAQQSEEFLGSEVFLEAMKQSMDSALMFREQMNAFLHQATAHGPVPTRQDTETITQALRSFEDRVIDQLSVMANRLDALESQVKSDGSGAKKVNSGTGKKTATSRSGKRAGKGVG